MRIIILNDYAFINGGAGQIALTTAIELAKKGYDTTLFTAVGPIDSSLKDMKNLNVVCLDQYDILNDPNRLRAMINGIWNIKAQIKFKELLNQFNPNNTIIHVHTYAKALSSSCVRVAVKKGFKILHHLHDYGIACPNMGFYNYKTQRVCSLKPLSMKCIFTNCDVRCYLHKIWRVIRQFVQKNMGKVDSSINYIYISNFSYKILKEFFSIKTKTYFLSNPINCKKEDRVIVENNKYFTFVGRLSPEKNPVLLARVAKKLNLPVMFIGSGSCEADIKRIYPEAIITGWQKKDTLNSLLKKTKCLIFPSNWYEGQPLVILECLAKGIPCVVSNISAAKDEILENKNGLIFESNNLKSLILSIKKLENKQFISFLSQKAYERFWEKDNSIDIYIESLLRIYHKCLENNDSSIQ